jgi:peptidoglycan-N-acetylglucosamine deacetylase
MLKEIAGWTIALFVAYAILPTIVSFIRIRVRQYHSTTREIAFTFDDGPDPTYTPKLLDLLKQYQIKATFFVLGSKAEKYPQLIQRMHQEGHLIGIHNYVHKSNWFRFPWVVCRELDYSSFIIEQLIGVRPIYYRPPWGLLTIFNFGLRKHFEFVLWSLMVGDWRSKGGCEKIKRRLLQNISPGDIILLHDSGDTWGADPDAPSYTIEALEEVFREVKSQGYNCVRMDDIRPEHITEGNMDHLQDGEKSIIVR